jgi:hypothetical protein
MARTRRNTEYKLGIIIIDTTFLFPKRYRKAG